MIGLLEMDKEGEHWRRCTFYTNKAMGLVTGAVYVNATSTNLPIGQVSEYRLKQSLELSE